MVTMTSGLSNLSNLGMTAPVRPASLDNPTPAEPSDHYTASDADWQPPTRAQMLALAPEQRGGGQQETIQTRHYSSEAEAGSTFRRESEYMLRPGGWNGSNCSATEPKWSLMDKHGMEDNSNRPVQNGDVLRIANPGEANYFVKVEGKESSPGHVEFTVRPTNDPNVPASSGETTHFFTNEATRTFSLDQKGKEVTFTTQGRNEHLNVGSQSGPFKAGNAAGGAFIEAGGGDLYWGGFATKLMEQ